MLIRPTKGTCVPIAVGHHDLNDGTEQFAKGQHRPCYHCQRKPNLQSMHNSQNGDARPAMLELHQTSPYLAMLLLDLGFELLLPKTTKLHARDLRHSVIPDAYRIL